MFSSSSSVSETASAPFSFGLLGCLGLGFFLVLVVFHIIVVGIVLVEVFVVGIVFVNVVKILVEVVNVQIVVVDLGIVVELVRST